MVDNLTRKKIVKHRLSGSGFRVQGSGFRVEKP